jgi:hypothetical protein
MISIPIRGQYEQVCNAAALEKLGITCLQKIDENFSSVLYNWLSGKPFSIDYSKTIPEALDYLFALHEKITSNQQEEELVMNKTAD